MTKDDIKKICSLWELKNCLFCIKEYKDNRKEFRKKYPDIIKANKEFMKAKRKMRDLMQELKEQNQ